MPRIKGAPNITPSIKQTIIKEARASIGKPREKVAEEIAQLLEEKGEKSPSFETLLKMVSEVWNQHDPEDNPWGVTTLADSKIPPETLPKVLEVWRMTLEWKWVKPLSIREAKWVSRLSYAIEDLETLCSAAVTYALIEEVGHIAGGTLVDPLFDADLYSMMTGLDVSWEVGEFSFFVPGHKKPESYDKLKERANLYPSNEIRKKSKSRRLGDTK